MAGLGFKDFQVGEVLTSSDVDGYLMQQAVMRFADSGARGSALGTAAGTGVPLAEGMVSYLDDINSMQIYNGSAWIGVGGLQAVEVFTSNGTFDLASYPSARGLFVRVQGAGGGGAANNGGGQGGGGGAFGQSFIDDLSAFGTAVSVTVGGGGTGGTGSGTGTAGGSSSFGTAVTANGGGGGTSTSQNGATGGTADVLIPGRTASTTGGDAFMGHGGIRLSGVNGVAGRDYGGGGSGGATDGISNGSGAAGADGIVIVEVYA